MGRIVDVINKGAHIWYVIDSEGNKRAVMGVQFVDTYSVLCNKEYLGQPGIFFVRDAAEQGYGDPTVHEGWAAYVWDNMLTAEKAGWRKIAEQESVDGPWGIDERILNMLVKKTDFSTAMESVGNRITGLADRTSSIENNLTGINESIRSLNEAKHTHDNKAQLDKIGISNGHITIDGQLAKDGYFFYFNIENGKLIWEDPSNTSVRYPVENSDQLAALFANSEMACAGMTIGIAEPSGMLTKFNIVPADGKLGAEFVESYYPVHVVNTLPDPNNCEYMGLWKPIVDDGTNLAFHYYKAVAGGWVDVTVLDEGESIDELGASFSTAATITNPYNPISKNYLTWIIPAGTYLDNKTGRTYKHGKTFVVRKFGSEPKSINDGHIVTVVEGSDTSFARFVPYVDVIPCCNEKVYYKLFSFTTSGAAYATDKSSVISPEPITWDFITKLPERYRRSYFSVGDTVYLPKHPKFGFIGCEVINVNPLVLATKDVLTVMSFGKSNDFHDSDVKKWLEDEFGTYTKLKVTSDTIATYGKTYWMYNGSKFEQLDDIEDGDILPYHDTVYESDKDFKAGLFASIDLPNKSLDGIENISNRKNLPKLKVGLGIDWWTSDVNASAVVTHSNAEGVDPSSECGVVAVFTIVKRI